MKFLKCAVLPALLGQGTALLFLLLSAICLQGVDAQDAAVSLLPIFAVVLSSLLCGLLSALFSKEGAFQNPLFAGGLMALMHLCLSLLPAGGGKGVLLPLVLAVLQPCLSFAVGMLVFKKGKGSAQKMRKKAKRRYRGRA